LGTKKVPLGANFTHYDNTQAAQNGRRIPDATLVQHFQHTLTPAQLHILYYLLLALLTLGTLAQTRVCLLLANLTALAPNTWRQRLKRLRQQPFPEQTLFPTLLRLVVEWLHLSQVFLA
jgi:hypothetical protein